MNRSLMLWLSGGNFGGAMHYFAAGDHGLGVMSIGLAVLFWVSWRALP